MPEPVQIRVQGSPAAVAAAYARIGTVLAVGVKTTRPLRGGSGAIFGDFAAVVDDQGDAEAGTAAAAEEGQ